jgi:hypothetical protein
MIMGRDITGTNMSWHETWAELIELFEAVFIDRDLNGAIAELCDVYSMLIGALYCQLGVNIPLFWLKSYNEWMRRIEVWEMLFAHVGLEFKLEYIHNGGNYKRRHKIRMALELALKDQR